MPRGSGRAFAGQSVGLPQLADDLLRRVFPAFQLGPPCRLGARLGHTPRGSVPGGPAACARIGTAARSPLQTARRRDGRCLEHGPAAPAEHRGQAHQTPSAGVSWVPPQGLPARQTSEDRSHRRHGGPGGIRRPYSRRSSFRSPFGSRPFSRPISASFSVIVLRDFAQPSSAALRLPSGSLASVYWSSNAFVVQPAQTWPA